MNEFNPLDGVYFWVPDCNNPSLRGHMIKIGRSKNVLKRSGGLQTGCPYLLRQLWFLSVPSISARDLESDLHQHFKRFHVHHEWFSFPTLHWRMISKTMHWHYDNATWEPLINNGPVSGHYAPKEIRPEMIDVLVDKAMRHCQGEAA